MMTHDLRRGDKYIWGTVIRRLASLGKVVFAQWCVPDIRRILLQLMKAIGYIKGVYGSSRGGILYSITEINEK
jgi:hypothetical protein